MINFKGYLAVHLVICCTSLGIWSGCHNGRGEAETLLQEARELTTQGQEAEKTDYSAALHFYEEALKRIDDLSTRYPSLLSDQPGYNQELLGPYTITELRERVLPLARQKAEAEKDPLACALLLISAEPDTPDRATRLAEAAKVYAALGQEEKVREIVHLAGTDPYQLLRAVFTQYFSDLHANRAWALASSLEDEEVRDWAWEQIAQQHSEQGQLEEALQSLNFIKGPAVKSDALVALANRYMEAGVTALSVDWGGWKVGELWDVPHSPRRVLVFPYRLDKAADLLLQAQQAAEAIDEFSLKTTRLAEILQGYAAAEQYERALQLVTYFRDPELKAKLLLGIAFRRAATGQAAVALLLLDDVKQLGQSIPDLSVRTSLLKEAARIYVAAGREEAALQLAASFKNPHARAEVLLHVVRRYAASRRHEEARQLAVEIPEESPRIQAMAAIAQSYLIDGQLEKAALLSREMGGDLPTIARRFAEHGQEEKAERIAEGIPQAAQRAEAFVDIASRLLTAGAQEQGAEVLRQALQVIETIPNMQERDKVRTVLTRALEEAGHPAPAQQMAETIVAPSTRATMLTEVACRFFEINEEGQGNATLARAVLASKAIRILADRATVEANMARQITRSRRFPQAIAIALQLQDTTLRANVLTNIARVCVEAGQYDTATQVANAIHDLFARSKTLAVLARKALTDEHETIALHYAEAIATVRERDQIFMALARRHIAMARVEDALALAARIRTVSVKAKVLMEIARVYLAAGQEDRAIQLVHELTDAFARDELAAELAKHYAAQDQLENAILWVNLIMTPDLREHTVRVIAKSPVLQSTEKKGTALFAMAGRELGIKARELAAAGECDRARQVMETIEDPILRVTVRAAAAFACFENKHDELGGAFFTQALSAVNDIRSPNDKAKALTSVTRYMIVARQLDSAVAAAELIDEPTAHAEVLANIARAYLEIGQSERAVALVQPFSGNLQVEGIFVELARRYTQEQQWDQAQNMARRMVDPYAKAKTFIEIAQACAEHHLPAKAAELLAVALHGTAGLEQAARAAIAANVARGYLVNNDREQALGLARTIRDPDTQTSVFVAIVKEDIEEGNLAQAAQMAGEITDPDLREDAWKDIVFKCVESGDYDRALATVSRLEDPSRRTELGVMIATEELTANSDISGQEKLFASIAQQVANPREDVGGNVKTMLTLIGLYLKGGGYERAGALLALLTPSAETVGVRAEIARQYAAVGENDRAEQLFTTALQEAALLPDVEERAQALLHIGPSYVSAGVSSGHAMRALLREMVERAERTKPEDHPS